MMYFQIIFKPGNLFYSLGLDINNNEKIKSEEIINAGSVITKSILFIYSMETFLPYTLNKVDRDKDVTKVYSLGPFAWTL